jgi:hypothetical protein
MTEQTEQTEQTTQEQAKTKPITEMNAEEISAELKRLQAEEEEDQKRESEAPPAKLQQGFRTGGGSASRVTAMVDAEAASIARRNLVREYEHLEKDERFNDEHRAQKAWEKYDEAKAVVGAKGRAAHENLLKAAEQYEQMSIPFPGGHSLRTEQVEHLNLTQGERTRIMDRLAYKNPTIERMQKEGKKTPSGPSPKETLRDEYARGLDIGGPQGAAICRAVVQIAEDQGRSVDDIVADHRSEWQYGYLQSAADARLKANNIYTRVPMPSYPRPGGPKSLAEMGSRKRSALGIERKGHSGSGPIIPGRGRRKPPWK